MQHAYKPLFLHNLSDYIVALLRLSCTIPRLQLGKLPAALALFGSVLVSWNGYAGAAYHVEWCYVQHRQQDAKDHDLLTFRLQDDGGRYPKSDVVSDVTLYAPGGDKVPLSALEFRSELSMYGIYKAETGEWFYKDSFSHESHFRAKIRKPLTEGTYNLAVRDNEGNTSREDFEFSGFVPLPRVDPKSVRCRVDVRGNLICEWAVPYYLDPEWKTSARAIIAIHKSGNYVGEVYVKLPTHLGRLFVPNKTVDLIRKQGDTFKIDIQLRTNDNCNRSYSGDHELSLQATSR